MCKYIKPILLFINMVFFTDCFAQAIYDPSAAKKYDSVYKKLPYRIQKALFQSEKDTSFDHGLAILTEDKIDTLNKSELRQDNLPQIVLSDIDPKTHKELKPKSPKSGDDKQYLYVDCVGSLFKDTLVIQISDLFFGHAVMHRVLKNSITTAYAEYIKYDTVFKINRTDSLTNLLSIPAETVKFYLSDTAFEMGEIIYGNAEIITNTYFEKDTWEENAFYKLRRRMKYYFKFEVKKFSL